MAIKRRPIPNNMQQDLSNNRYGTIARIKNTNEDYWGGISSQSQEIDTLTDVINWNSIRGKWSALAKQVVQNFMAVADKDKDGSKDESKNGEDKEKNVLKEMLDDEVKRTEKFLKSTVPDIDESLEDE